MTRLSWRILTGSACILVVGAVLLRAQSVPTAPVNSPQLAAGGQAPIDFARDIQPIFKQDRAECHGPTKARARLRLHTPEAILRGGLSGPPVTPHKSDVSLLMRRVLGLDGEDQMPLDGDPLPEAAIARLRAWIDQGGLMPGAAGTGANAAARPTADTEHWSVREADAAGAAAPSRARPGRARPSTASCWRGSSGKNSRRRPTRRRQRCSAASRSI